MSKVQMAEVVLETQSLRVLAVELNQRLAKLQGLATALAVPSVDPQTESGVIGRIEKNGGFEEDGTLVIETRDMAGRVNYRGGPLSGCIAGQIVELVFQPQDPKRVPVGPVDDGMLDSEGRLVDNSSDPPAIRH